MRLLYPAIRAYAQPGVLPLPSTDIYATFGMVSFFLGRLQHYRDWACHRYRLRGRLHPCIAPFETGVINGKVLTGLTDAQLENLDMIEGDEYERKTVEVVLTDTLEKMEVEAFIWANKDDPDMYGEWDFEEWKRLHMEKFIEASKKFIEWKKNSNGKTREEFAKFVNEDPPVA
ncbi:protein AIG2 B-like [Brassica napus]|uniref:protein AIG2 B-like n=1 Tax=Brassica napus TaxID=3708 RepID=UPI002078E449|nr:protein AIG2 B-like [Brassica napus]